MTFRVLQLARKETQRAAEWYDEQRPGLGDDFLAELGATYTKIAEHPHRPLRVHARGLGGREFHQAKLQRFPYKVIYEVSGDDVVVFAVAHVKQRPNYWIGRA